MTDAVVPFRPLLRWHLLPKPPQPSAPSYLALCLFTALRLSAMICLLLLKYELHGSSDFPPAFGVKTRTYGEGERLAVRCPAPGAPWRTTGCFVSLRCGRGDPSRSRPDPGLAGEALESLGEAPWKPLAGLSASCGVVSLADPPASSCSVNAVPRSPRPELVYAVSGRAGTARRFGLNGLSRVGSFRKLGEA